MLKALSLLQRRADFDLAAFSEYWRTVHKAHALKLVDAGFIRGYIQNHRLGEAAEDLPGLPLAADGSPELWIDDADVLARLVASREYREGAGPDEANFVTPPVRSAVARERVLIGGALPAGAVKLMLVANRDPAIDAKTFAARWLAADPLALMPGAQPLRLSRHVALAGDAFDGAFDGAEFSWWPDLATLQAAWARRDRAPFDGLAAPGSLRGLVVREEVVVAPPAPAPFLRASLPSEKLETE